MDRSGSTVHSRIAGRRMRVGVFNHQHGRIVAKSLLPAGSDVVLAAVVAGGLVVADWPGPSLILVSEGKFLHLAPGMRLHMCHDNGEDRVVGEYDEVVARGLVPPICINVSKLNIRVRDKLSVFVKYLADDEPAWPDEGDWRS